jgi:hypothetical protein
MDSLSLLLKLKSDSLLLNFMTDVMSLVILGPAILLASWMLLRFDQSKLPKQLIQNTFGKVMN